MEGVAKRLSVLENRVCKKKKNKIEFANIIVLFDSVTSFYKMLNCPQTTLIFKIVLEG